jgi:tetratricopeptide (TPR) repeat protein
MSRSIHVTRQTIARARRFGYANRDRRAALLDDLETRHARKRRMKWAMRQKVRPALFPGAPVTADEVAISFDRRSPFARYPASEADIRAVLSRLPSGVLDGLNGLSVSLGAEYQRDQAEEWHERDPVVGRFGLERLSGIYCGLTLGVCFWNARSIKIYGFVSAQTLESPWALYLRLHMLATLVHEVAHHEDRMKGWAGDRWTGDDEHKTEWYAESRQLLWVETLVIPYLQEAYPAEVALLEDWMREHIGLVLPLRILAGDARIRGKKHGKRLWLNAYGGSSEAFEGFVRDVAAGEDLTEVRLHLAKGLHHAREFDYAQKVIDEILAAHPDHVLALVQKARIYRELRRWWDAVLVLARANHVDNRDSAVWEEFAYLSENVGHWDKVLRFASDAIECANNGLVRLHMHELQGRAHIALGDYQEARNIIAAFTATGKPSDARAAARLHARLDQALASKSALKSGEPDDDQD